MKSAVNHFLDIWPMVVISLVVALILFLVLSRGSSIISWVTVVALIITHIAAIGHHYGETSHITMTMVGALWVWFASNTRETLKTASCYASLCWEGRLKVGQRVTIDLELQQITGVIEAHDVFSLALRDDEGKLRTISNTVVFPAHKTYHD